MPIASLYNDFWNRCPALLYGLCALLSCYATLQPSWIILIPMTLFLIPQLLAAWYRLERALHRIFLCCILFLCISFYTSYAYLLPTLPPEGVKGAAHLSITSLQARSTHFGRQWIHQGRLLQFTPENALENGPIGKNLPISLSLPDHEHLQRPLANQDYLVHGILKQTDRGQYILKVFPKDPWHPILGSWSLAEYRYHAKQLVKRYISSHIPSPYSASFLSGLATGEFESRLLAFEFSRFGLQHIMAISGFHFSIIAAILGLFFRFTFSRKRGAAFLALLLCSYFLFLGCTPSIMRAWIAISAYLIAQLLEKRASALNSLGVALLAILLIDPLSCTNMGFQLSFLTTAAILLLYSGCDFFMEKALSKRSLSQMIRMNLLNQHGYTLLCFFRQGIALSLAVNLVALPVTLFAFQKFPWMSLLYNLFFPFLVSGAMLLLLIGVLLSLTIPPAADWIHALNSGYTQWVLNFTLNMPTSFDIYLRIDTFPSWVLTSYLSVLFFAGIVIKQQMEKKKEQLQDLAFL